ncbi:MAG: hypothetical protein HDT28_09055 [Clostridiales bacterium]|nr:hypothetical protein [Clostridiales bacterium]
MKRHTTATYNKEKRTIARAVIAIATFITALAIAVTCALCFNARSAEMNVGNSANEVTTSVTNRTAGGDFSAAGALAKGDTFTLSYAASNDYSITLPAGGTFTFEVWGASGGQGYSVSGAGGKGGYTKATYKTTAKTTIHVVVGGAGVTWSGSNKTNAGGYNGGGNSQSQRTCSHGSGSGGGATHIATAAGELSGVSSSSVLIVAGGGGGAGNASYAGGNGGGDTSGVTGEIAGQNSGNAGSNGGYGGGSASSGAGSGKGSGSTYPGSAGSFGKGGNGGTASNYNGGAGGGGGYHGGGGGAAPSTCACHPGGGGSSYVMSGLTNTVFKSGQQSGNGQAIITVDEVNQNPTSKNATNVAINARGTTSTAIAASTIAQDPDPANASTTATTASVYFTAGSSSNYDTLPAANAGLWVNGTSTVATTYFDWTWAASTLTITKVKKYPRVGVDGCTTEGVLTLYTKVRDSFGTTTTRGTSTISFTVKVAVNTIALNVLNTANYNSGPSTGVYSSTLVPSTVADNTRYSTATGRQTIFIKKALAVNESVTIAASDIVGGTAKVNALDTPVISLYNTSAFVNTFTTRKYKVDELDNNTNKLTAYSNVSTAIPNAFTQITITAVAVDSAYQVLPIRIYAVEGTTVGSIVNNCAAGVGYIDVDVVFLLENTRPVLSSASNLVDLNVGETKSLTLSSYITDVDGIDASSHTILSVKVPENEVVQVSNRSGSVQKNVIGGGAASSYNVGSGSLHTNVLTNAYTNTSTGFSSYIAYNAKSPVSGTSANQAFMSFTYTGNNNTLSVTGLRSSFNQYLSGRANALGHFYLILNIKDTRNAADTGIWLPIAFRVGYNTSWTPTATVTAPNSLTGQSTSSTYPTASGSVGQSFYFAPMAINNGTSKVVGQYSNGSSYTNSGLQPLAIDGDNFTTDTGTATWGAKTVGFNEFLRLNSFSAIDFVKTVSEDGATGNATSAQNKYVKAETIDIYVPKTSFNGGRVVVDADTGLASDGRTHILLTADGDYYKTSGIKLTLLSATMNRYFYGTVGVIDSAKKTVTGINIAIRVNNRTPVGEEDATKVATESVYSDYEYNKAQGNPPTITFKMPLGEKIIVTPYDFISDPDMANHAGESNIIPKFTLNGVTGRYVASTGMLISGGTAADGGVEFNGLYDGTTYNVNNYADMLKAINGTNTVKKVSSTTAGNVAGASAVANAGVYRDKLFFTRSSDTADAYAFNPTSFNNINSTATNTNGFITYSFGSSVKLAGEATAQNIDFIVISSISRTSQPAYIDLTVRDRYGDGTDGAGSIRVRIKIEVINTAPQIKNANRVVSLAAAPVDNSGTVIPTAITLPANGNNDANGLMVDPDKDTPDFVTSSGLLVASKRGITYDECTSFDDFISDPDNAVFLTDGNGKSLDNYITATLDSRYQMTVTALSSTKAIAGGVYVYFYVNDGNGGTSLGFIQIEVVDSAPELNTDENYGFNEFEDGQTGEDSAGQTVVEKLPTWTIETTSTADISRNRYIVGSETSIDYLKAFGAVDTDIKLIATDADGLHNNVLLSPMLEAADGDKYVNKELPEANGDGSVTISRAWFKSAVPDVTYGNTFAENANSIAATVYYRVKNVDGTVSTSAEMSGYTAQMMYYHNGTWLTITEFVDAVFGSGNDNLSLNNLSTYIDGKGRFVYPYWALRLYAPTGMASNSRVAIKLSLRDEAHLGGDTAGIATAYQPLRSDTSGMNVIGALKTTVYQYIASTGIRTKDEFSKYNDYYVVEHTRTDGSEASTKAYYSTYDGVKTNAYGYGATIGYKVVDGVAMLDTAATGNNVIKAASGNEDGTKAGATAGTEYKTGNEKLAGAYKYVDTIEIPTASVDLNDTANTVYVPMSFFGMMKDLIGIDDQTVDGGVVYSDNYVGYNVGSNGTPYVRGTIDDIASAISITDGDDIWTGDELNSNPYVTIGAFDDYSKTGITSSLTKFITTSNTETVSYPYYNNRLAVLTVDGDDHLNNLYMDPTNRNSFVGDGRIMYLEDQSVKLQEHNFGLTFNKKNMRTGTRDLTITINLARAKWTSSYSGNVDVGETSADVESNTRSVTVKIHIENAKLELSQARAGDGTALQYDGNTYYVDVTLATAESQSFMLVRRGESGVESGNATYSYASKLAYTDADYGIVNSTTYRDNAYFYADSFSRLGSWLSGEGAYTRAVEYDDDNNLFVHTAVNATEENKDQKSMLNYFGGDMSKLNTDAKVEAFQPNDGMYGTSNDGYSSYFNASLVDNGKVINIMATRKTFINEDAFVKDEEFNENTATIDDVKAEYLKRGLIAEWDASNTAKFQPSRVYYPFRVIVYDDCGAGFTDGSYTSIEFRVQIGNAKPTLKGVGEASTLTGAQKGDRTYSVNLAVGNSITFNLYDFISDPDITASGSGSSLLTKNEFLNLRNVYIETGDYLDSPFAHDDYLNKKKTYDPNNSALKEDGSGYYRDGGGFSPRGDKTRDVIMWMDTANTDINSNSVPGTNNITFTVNRRTTSVINGSAVSINEYRFTLKFYDGSDESGAYTSNLTFIINITNQTPRITTTTRNFTMHSGDDLTILTTYYDTFLGGDNSSYVYSSTKTAYDSYIKGSNYQRNGMGRHNAVGAKTENDTSVWYYSNITSSEYDKVVTNSDINREYNDVRYHLGFFGLADDDTPWQLRISGFSYYNGSGAKINVTDEFRLASEGSTTSASMPLALRVQALRACTNEPLIVTIDDGEGGVISCTLYFTVISSSPVALSKDNPTEAKTVADAGLEFDTVESSTSAGSFRLYTVPSSNSTYAVAGENKSARNEYTIYMTDVAKDPDGDTETANMTLYGNGEFAVSGNPLSLGSDGIYHSECFDIQILSGGKAFKLTARDYNPSIPYETLSFRVADAGNGAYDNSIEITLNVYTLYSDMTNASAAALTGDKLTAYLEGSEVVNVKSYDAYYSASGAVKSTFAQLKLSGNQGNDGNNVSPIADPDVKTVGSEYYTTRLYALMEVDGNAFKAISSKTLASSFTINSARGNFYLTNRSSFDRYLIGGIQYDGVNATVLSRNPEAAGSLIEVNKYVDFEFAPDGSAIMFTPVASTLDNKNILLYVETEKYVDDSRSIKRDDAALSAGAVFRLNVQDSAPQTLTAAGMTIGINQVVSGYAGEDVRLTIHNESDPFNAMFIDSDARDIVTIKKFDDAAYEKAMKKAIALYPDLDWNKDDKSKPRAFSVDVDSATNELVIHINRRVDIFENNKYMPSVTFPIEFTGVDILGASATSVVELTIYNTEAQSVNRYVAQYDNLTGVGYTFDVDDNGEYNIKASLQYSKPLTISLADFMIDHDTEIAPNCDADSYVFASSTRNIYPYEYLGEDVQKVYWFDTYNGTYDPDSKVELATVTPVGADKWHRNAITITATNTTRSLSARTYLRILDRSTDSDDRDTGVFVTLDITVMNDAPHVKENMSATTEYMIGSETSTTGRLFFIGDYVADNNESDASGDVLSAQTQTYLRIFTHEPRQENFEIYSIKYDTVADDNIDFYTSSLFEVSRPTELDEDLLAEYLARKGLDESFKDTSNIYNQWFVIKPIAGYYGKGAVDITIADGDANISPDTMLTTFRINIEVLYSQTEANNELNSVTLACSKSTTLDIGRLMPELENKLKLDLGGQNNAEGDSPEGDEGSALTSADGNSDTFSQSSYYELTSVEFQNATDSSYATLERIGESAVWRLTANNQVTFDPIRINVKYRMRNDPSREYSKYFRFNVIANQSPQAKYTEITFVRYDRVGDGLHDLDDSNTVRLEAWQLFSDADDPEGAAIRILSVKSQVSSIVKASLSEDKRYIVFTFAARGKSNITVEVTDETGAPVLLSFVAKNEDLPAGSLWLQIRASFEGNTLIWAIIIGCVLLLLILLIILIAVLRKRKQAREELEALLVSEMEIEEQMIKLAGGPAPTDYQSFGYLPPSVTIQQTTTTTTQMLGTGGSPDQSTQPIAELPPPEDGNAQ